MKLTKPFQAIISVILIAMFIFAGGMFFANTFAQSILSDMLCRLNAIRVGSQDAQPLTRYAPTSAQLTDISSNFMTSYFYNLNYGFHNNNDKSCAIVAMELLLLYYNSYWNDDFVDEACEINTTLLSTSGFMGYNSPSVSENTTPNLFNQLSTLATSFGYYVSGVGFNMYSDSQCINVLNEYLYNRIDTTQWTYTSAFTTTPDAYYPNINLTYSQQYEQNIISLVSSRVPVLALYHTLQNNLIDHHASIAYYYDADDQRLFHHTGLLNDPFNYYTDPNDKVVGYVALLNLNAPHSHSNNYVVNGTNICSCALSNHQHKYSYAQYNNLKHKMTCYCGYTTYGYYDYVSYGLTTYCMYCGHIGDSNIPTPHLSIIIPD